MFSASAKPTYNSKKQGTTVQYSAEDGQPMPSATEDLHQHLFLNDQTQISATTDKPPSAIQDQPQHSATNDQPQSSVIKHQPQTSATNDQANPSATNDQAKPSATNEQPQPLATNDQAKPSATNEQPQPSAKKDQTQTSATKDQPHHSTIKDNPQTLAKKDQTQHTDINDQPRNSATKDQPRNSATKDPRNLAIKDQHQTAAIKDQYQLTATNDKSQTLATKDHPKETNLNQDSANKISATLDKQYDNMCRETKENQPLAAAYTSQKQHLTPQRTTIHVATLLATEDIHEDAASHPSSSTKQPNNTDQQNQANQPFTLASIKRNQYYTHYRRPTKLKDHPNCNVYQNELNQLSASVKQPYNATSHQHQH